MLNQTVISEEIDEMSKTEDSEDVSMNQRNNTMKQLGSGISLG